MPDDTTRTESARARVLSDADRSEEMLDHLLELASEQLDREDQLPTSRKAAPEVLRQELGIEIGQHGQSMDAVVSKLRRILAATPSSASPRFLNQLFGGRDTVATLAEMLTPLVNTSMYTYKAAGAQILVEREVIDRMAAKVGFPDGEGLFCPGGTLSNLVAMLVARNEAVPTARDEGLLGEGLIVYSSLDGHYSIQKSAGVLGIGRHNVRHLPTDERGRMDVEALREAIHGDRAAGRRPFFVNATAGTTVRGAFDPLAEIAGVTRDEGLWMHVDGALGGSVVLSEDHRDLLEGAHLADSFAWNAHKMMGVPLSCSVTLFRRTGLLNNHLNEAADYLFQTHDDELNPGTRSLQCGRRNDALKLWAAWQLHGDDGYDARLRRLFELARFAAKTIEADPELRLVAWPESINVCFEVPGVSSAEICDRLDSSGRLLIGHGTVDDRSAIRLVVVNPDLGRDQLVDALTEVKLAATQLMADTAGDGQPS